MIYAEDNYSKEREDSMYGGRYRGLGLALGIDTGAMEYWHIWGMGHLGTWRVYPNFH